jgi:hypothetical protein
MNNYEFIKASDAARDLCGQMSVNQMKELLRLLAYDIEAKQILLQGRVT